MGFNLAQAERGEVPAVEGRTPALMVHGAPEALAYRVVLRGSGRDAMVPEHVARPLSVKIARDLTP